MSYRKNNLVILSRQSAAKDLSREIDFRFAAAYPAACEVPLPPSADRDDNV